MIRLETVKTKDQAGETDTRRASEFRRRHALTGPWLTYIRGVREQRQAKTGVMPRIPP